MKLTLRVRNLETGELGTVDFENEENATVWLRSRPRFVEVLGLAHEGVAPEISNALRAAMRPLDAAERVLEQKLTEAQKDALEKMARARVEREKAETAAHRAGAASDDPNRPMDLHWTYDRGLDKQDASDARAITDEARAAVLAWVAERDDWVRDRGQIVGDAKVTVYPGELPKGKERVLRGTFMPCTAPPERQKMN